MDPTPLALDEKLARLRHIISGYGSALVAFSGGVDSTLVLAVAVAELGDRAVALTAVSETMARREVEEAQALARRLSARHEIVASHELARPGFAENPPDRCYHCKAELMDLCQPVADRLGLGAVLLGTNLDDLGDHRPGIAAARERGARQPLVEAGLGKGEVRALSRQLGLPTWDKPQLACLSSRFPYGTQITPERLRMVDAFEDALRELGFRQLRVRLHALPEVPGAQAPAGALARLELPEEELAQALTLRQEIAARGKAAGFVFVALDLEGFRSGSANVVLQQIGVPKKAVPAPPSPRSPASAPKTASLPSSARNPENPLPQGEGRRARKIVVAGLVQDAAGAVLLSQRRADQAMPLMWELPGGKVEPGEAPEAALFRELYEELGAKATVGPIYEVVSYRYPDFDLLMLVYRCTLDRPPRPVEVADVRFVPPAELLDYAILPADGPLIEKIQKGHWGSGDPVALRPDAPAATD